MSNCITIERLDPTAMRMPISRVRWGTEQAMTPGGRPFNEHSFPGGRRFHFADPGGNELAVWSER